MKSLLYKAGVLSTIIGMSLPVQAQQYGRNDNPNLRNFYMARQQIQITDDVPAVNDLRTNPQPAQPGAAAPVPSAPQALPRAGFNSYMSGLAGGAGRNTLPSASNGIPKLAPAGPNLTGRQAQPVGKVNAKAPAAPKAPPIAKTYTPYATKPVAASGNSGAGLNTSTSVQGSVLHWNRKRTGY